MINEIRKCKNSKEKYEIIKKCDSIIELIKGCENLNELYEIIIIISYDFKLDNCHQKRDYSSGSNWKYAKGYYLIPKKIKGETESHLDTLILSIIKKLNKIYSAEIKEIGDKEFYETLAYSELLEVLHYINNNHGFEFILSKFESVDLVNEFCGFILSIIANRNYQKVRGNKTNCIIAKSRKINDRTVWNYEYLNYLEIDGTIKDNKSDEVYSMYEYILNQNINYANSEESGLYNYDNYNGLDTEKIDNDNITSYLASKINLLTTAQQDYLKNNNDKRNYQMDRKIRERLVKKLSNDKNIEIKLDSYGNLIHIKLKDNYFSILDVILSQRNNKTKFLKLIEVIKKNNRYSDRLMDLILELKFKFYHPIIKYLNDDVLDMVYIDSSFNHVLYKLKLNL
ncbi:hypothetical protein KD33_07895 [Clostridium sp. NCR]|nr:hypothetical protein KD33_07895 [Clostridium sp. NCR]